MKERLLLISFGLFVAILLNLAAYPFLRGLAERWHRPAGSQFKDLNELRKAMLERDERDLKSDRSVTLRSLVQPHPSDRIIYDLIPNQSVKFQGVPVTTNSCAMRDSEFLVAKQPNQVRIALLGDSFAFGWGVEEHESFSEVAEEKLNKIFNGQLNFEILNFGVPGYSTFQELALFEDRVLDLEPDLVLVFFVENDFGLPFFVENVNQPGQIVDLNSAKGSSPLSFNIDPNHALLRLADITREKGIELIVVPNPGKGFQSSVRRLWALRKGAGIKSIKLLKEIRHIVKEQRIDLKDLSLPTDPHPSALKHLMMGELLAEKLAGRFVAPQ